MRRLWCIPFFFVLFSCKYFLSKEERTQRLVNEELMAIDWNDVDQFPLFDECDETATKEAQRHCFETEMLQRFSKAFNDTVFEVEQEIQDTLEVDFVVDEDGFINITEIEQNATIEAVIPGFRDEVRNRLKDLTVLPAHKRGIPVSIRFRLPIIVDTKK